MGRPLSELTLEELWEMFPILLTEPNEEWAQWYAEEERRLKALLPSDAARISHMGSTAIGGIWAKPIVDILVELPAEVSMEEIKENLVQNGYTCMLDEGNRISLNRGYTSEGFEERAFHLHLRHWGDNDELYFRDYLNENPPLAKAYEELKRSLWKRFECDRDGYTSAKTRFVAEQTDRAKAHYGEKYRGR